jgi:hypothetical protein
MAEQTSTTNLTDWQRKQANWVDNENRQPLFKVVRGSVLKGYQVTIVGAVRNRTDLRPSDQVLVRTEAWGATQAHEALVVYRNLERAWRTKDEEALGREFTDEEAAEHERGMRLRVARHMTEHRAESINSKLAQMAERLQRASEEMRRLAATEYSLDHKVY